MTTASATLTRPGSESAQTSGATRESFSIVLETENVGSAGLDYLRRTLATLEAQTVSPRDSMETIVTQSGDVPDDVLDELGKKYPGRCSRGSWMLCRGSWTRSCSWWDIGRR
jgi:hypothetical protein